MPLSRRSLLRALLALPLAASAGVRHLFRPRELFTPRFYTVPVSISLDEINRITAAQIMPFVVDDYFKSAPLLAYLRGRSDGLPVRLRLDNDWPVPPSDAAWDEDEA